MPRHLVHRDASPRGAAAQPRKVGVGLRQPHPVHLAVTNLKGHLAAAPRRTPLVPRQHYWLAQRGAHGGRCGAGLRSGSCRLRCRPCCLWCCCGCFLSPGTGGAVDHGGACQQGVLQNAQAWRAGRRPASGSGREAGDECGSCI